MDRGKLSGVPIADAFRLALPTGAYYTWKGAVLEGTSIQPDELIEFDWQAAQANKDSQIKYGVESIGNRQNV